ncbi:MAG: hypothetical protein WCJ46_03490 [bacterium]
MSKEKKETPETAPQEKLSPEAAFIKAKKEKPWEKFRQQSNVGSGKAYGANKPKNFNRKSGM